MNNALPPKPRQLSAVVRDTPRAERLLITRRSGPNAADSLRRAHERTLARHMTIPGHSEIRATGIEPLFDRDRYQDWWALPSKGRATLFQVDGTYVLLVLGTVGGRDTVSSGAGDATENAVIELYDEVLVALKPRTVLTGPVSRLTRASASAHHAFLALRSNVSFLECDEGALEFDGLETERTWQAWTSDARASRRAAVDRAAWGIARKAARQSTT